MKHIKKFDNFLINEAVGLATATVAYTDMVFEKMGPVLDRFLKGENRKFKEIEVYEVGDDIINSPSWVNLPIKTIRVEYSFIRRTDEDFAKELPTTTKMGKFFTTTGFCSHIVEKKESDDDSYFMPPVNDKTDHTIYLSITVGAIICDRFEDTNGLMIELESTILHELNHAYEGYKRMMKGAPSISIDLTWSLDANRSRIKKDIWKLWYGKIGYYLYYSERHEINAMTQETWPYVRSYSPEDMMKKAPAWKIGNDLENFNAVSFKKEMCDLINKFYPDIDPVIILNRLKNGLANQLDKAREESIMSVEDAPSISGSKVRKMDIDKFLMVAQKRINIAGKELKKRITKLYSLKDEKN